MASRPGRDRGAVKLLRVIGLVLLLNACSDDELAPEEEIRQFIQRGVEAAEQRSLGDLNDMVHPDYRDQKGYNREQLGKLLQAYFFRHRNIHLFSRIDAIQLLAHNRAEVSLHVAMASSVISDVTALRGLRAQIYRFELQLVRQDDWLLQHASWAPASIADLQ